MNKHIGFRIFVGVVIAAVLAVIVAGMFIAGTPNRARERQLDDRRVALLQQITYGIDAFYQEKQRLPLALDELRTIPMMYLESIEDPQTKEPFAYRELGTKTEIGMPQYELCAVFLLPSDAQNTNGALVKPYAPGVEYSDEFWKHGVGRACFTLAPRKTNSSN